MDARALTEEAPRSAADLAADALDVARHADLHNVYERGYGLTKVDPHDHAGLAFQVQRLARQVAELAQLVEVVPAEIVDDADPRDAALDQIAATLRDADWSGVMYDDDVLYEIHAIITGTGRDAGPR